MFKIILSYILLHSFTSNTYASLNEFPIIGVFAQPSSDDNADCGGSCQYIAASYIKFIESAGARVVPISYSAENSEIDRLLQSLNGFFFPGGVANIPPAAQYLYDRIIRLNQDGIYIALWGTCLGFEWILCAATNDNSILDSGFDSYNLSLPVKFTREALRSQMFGMAPKFVMESLASKNITMNNHARGITVTDFGRSRPLMTSYSILSTNQDRAGVPFVSSIEHIHAPIFATMWHPEKSIFEWGKYPDGTPYEVIAHSYEAVASAQYLANFFVSRARKNKNSFADPAEEQRRLIYNYRASMTGPGFVQTYFFHF